MSSLIEQKPFCVDSFLEQWPDKENLKGLLLFGSRVHGENTSEDSDWDVGVIFKSPLPEVEFPPNWDMFYWRLSHWRRGFVLQLEIAGYAEILYDPDNYIADRFSFLQEKILPHWAGYLRRL